MARIAETMRDLRFREWPRASQADAVGVAIAKVVEDAADRVVDKLLIRLGARNASYLGVTQIRLRASDLGYRQIPGLMNHIS